MHQILFKIPLDSLNPSLPNIPIYGYGAMLFLAFILCVWLGVRLARREGLPQPLLMQDLAVWIFVFGLIGGRVTFMIQYGVPILEFPRVWEGGLVFYGAAIGAVIGYFLVYFVHFKKYGVSHWKMADIIAPCGALGLALGRVGCLLNGCCYGNVACETCPAITFPYPAAPLHTMVQRGFQTPAGFTISPEHPLVVARVEPDSPAARAGLQAGDRILKIGEREVDSYFRLETYLGREWPRGVNVMELTVRRDGREITLPPFEPESLGLHPTQVYETVSMVLLLFLLLSYYPFKKYDGSVMVLFMFGYGIHRFLNEMLRTDTGAVAFDMTLSQNISILVLASALILAIVIWRRKPFAHLAST